MILFLGALTYLNAFWSQLFTELAGNSSHIEMNYQTIFPGNQLSYHFTGLSSHRGWPSDSGIASFAPALSPRPSHILDHLNILASLDRRLANRFNWSTIAQQGKSWWHWCDVVLAQCFEVKFWAKWNQEVSGLYTYMSHDWNEPNILLKLVRFVSYALVSQKTYKIESHRTISFPVQSSMFIFSCTRESEKKGWNWPRWWGSRRVGSYKRPSPCHGEHVDTLQLHHHHLVWVFSCMHHHLHLLKTTMVILKNVGWLVGRHGQSPCRPHHHHWQLDQDFCICSDGLATIWSHVPPFLASLAAAWVVSK